MISILDSLRSQNGGKRRELKKQRIIIKREEGEKGRRAGGGTSQFANQARKNTYSRGQRGLIREERPEGDCALTGGEGVLWGGEGRRKGGGKKRTSEGGFRRERRKKDVKLPFRGGGGEKRGSFFIRKEMGGTVRFKRGNEGLGRGIFSGRTKAGVLKKGVFQREIPSCERRAR